MRQRTMLESITISAADFLVSKFYRPVIDSTAAQARWKPLGAHASSVLRLAV